LVGEADGRPVDFRIAGSAAALILVMFGRMSRLRAMLGGQLLVWGRRPWRLARLQRALPLP
jgi:hypothetical protein